jgi:hypothetical protein
MRPLRSRFRRNRPGYDSTFFVTTEPLPASLGRQLPRLSYVMLVEVEVVVHLVVVVLVVVIDSVVVLVADPNGSPNPLERRARRLPGERH